jgi:galactokinase
LPRERAAAFAPGRVNLIGEHTDYNGGLALPFAISEGITVRARRDAQPRISARAVDLDEHDEFALDDRSPATGWRAFVHGMVAELQDAGFGPAGAELEFGGGLPRGAGLSSSAALEVALCLALLALRNRTERTMDRIAIAQLCARVERRWVGAHTGLLDQLASLYGQRDAALLIDFAALRIEPVPLRLGRWRLVVLDSGERHTHASSGYNQRREECRRACELLGVRWLSEASADLLERLPEPLRRRARHVLSENERVAAMVAALRAGEWERVGRLLSASHNSLRDDFEVSTAAVERTVRALLETGAAGARVIGGGFGGSVLALFSPASSSPRGAREVRAGPGAHLLSVKH